MPQERSAFRSPHHPPSGLQVPFKNKQVEGDVARVGLSTNGGNAVVTQQSTKI
jgi:hypothetical protein